MIEFAWSWETALIAVGVALVVATAFMLFKRSKLKSVRFERTACVYTRGGSFALKHQQDTFLYRNITRVPIPRNNTSRRR